MLFSPHIPHWVQPYLRFFPTIALIAGFIIDALTINRPDALFENVVILGYLFLSAAAILALQAHSPTEQNENRRLLLLTALQFSFGSLASALLILYAHSGTFAGNAIFIGILTSLLVGNELLRSKYARMHLRVIIWFTLALTYSTLIVPVLLNSIGTFVFSVSVLVALSVVALLITLLSSITRDPFSHERRNIRLSVLLIAVFFSMLYFTHLIPPVPLALKHIGIYHSIERDGNSYLATYETPRWYEFWRSTNEVFHYTPNTPVFCFSAVFAPRNLKTEIRHRWEMYDPETEKWNTMARIPFPISGGRTEGFRGYTQTTQIREGLWRCSVETSRGSLIGRSTFRAELGSAVYVEKEL